MSFPWQAINILLQNGSWVRFKLGGTGRLYGEVKKESGEVQ